MTHLFSFKRTLFAALFLLSMLPAMLVSAANENAPDRVRVFVEYTPGQRQAAERALNRADAHFHYDFVDLNTYVVSLPEPALNGIENNPHVVFVEEDAQRELYAMGQTFDQMTELFTIDLPTEIQPYGVGAVQAPDVWAEGHDGSGRTVCIIDTGYYEAHPDLPNGVSGVSQISGEVFNEDGNGHGTHVAGTIAGIDNNVGVVGVAPGVDLFIVKIFDNNGVWTNSSDLIDAALSCENGGANVISMSLGGSRRVRSEQRAFDQIDGRGVLSIAAAGNDGNTQLSYPASYSSVMSVAAIDENNVKADFSQYNSAVEIAAPGVGVISTVPYISNSSITVNGTTYDGGAIEFAAEGMASGTLVDGGLCTSSGSWNGAVVLCSRGDISFYDKVVAAQNGGASAVVIYNNEPGALNATLGDGNSSSIPAIGITQADGQALVANNLGQNASVVNETDAPAAGYDSYNGTSMATPHVSAVAALVWSANTSWTNDEIRDALNNTALDLGSAGRDNEYGFGLVQAKAALDSLDGGNPPAGSDMHVSSIDMSSTRRGRNYKVDTTVTIVDENGAAVSNATVSVTVTLPDGSTSSGSATTGSNGSATLQVSSRQTGTYTATVTNVTHASNSYDASANVETTESISVP